MSRPATREAELRAEEVLADYDLSTLPIDPFELARRCSIDVKVETNQQNPGVSGALLKVGDTFGILCFARGGNRGYLRFTLGHELGHYFLPSHPGLLFGGGQVQHMSRAGFTSAEAHEREADHFAASLLMPRRHVLRAINEADAGLAAIEHLASSFETSLTASAIRYAALAQDPVAVIVSSGRSIEYCFCSESLQAVPGDMWLRKGELIPPDTITAKLNGQRRADGDVSLDTWFDGAPPADVYEEVVDLGSYGRRLTVLSSTESIEPEEPPDERVQKYLR